MDGYSSYRPNRRQLLVAIGVSAVALTVTEAHAAQPDSVAETYYRILLKHTRWAETQYDPAAGHYRRTDFAFAVVLGNAVLVTRGAYDEQAAGVSRDVLKQRTMATIKHFAATNRLAGGTDWGKTLFWDTTFQSYFVLAAKLLWQDLDPATKSNVDKIAAMQAEYTTSLGAGNDPDSGGWTPNGTAGGFQGDTKLEEMGVYAQAIAPGLVWAADVPAAWKAAYGLWSRNMTGLPAADLANPRAVDGVQVNKNTAANLYDTFIVENHGSFGPHYQEELWRTSGRNAIHFLLAKRPLPEVITNQPNSDRLWRTILGVMSDAGEPLMPMVNDREHLYGRDVIPLAFRAQVLGDRYAARAEADLAARLEAYQDYPPANRITKFSGEPKYEPEARAEIAISYLLHEMRTSPVRPVTAAQMFGYASGATDFGAGPGLLSHQTANAWAATVSKGGLVKFAWQPAHDDWLFKISGSTPMFLPATNLTVRARTTKAYSKARDGFEATASMLSFDNGRAGMTTLPTGTIVYATSGLAAGEGRITVHNLTMPGVLNGARTYTAAEGSVTVKAKDGSKPPGVARIDELTFARTTGRHVRMAGVRPYPIYGYSLFAFEVHNGSSADLAKGKNTTASSADVGREAPLATDGDIATRWAVSRADRTRPDSWLAVDLGAPAEFDRVKLAWETAAGEAYRVETSTDGTQWTTVATYPKDDLRSAGKWLDVDGKAGFVVRGPAPIAVKGDTIILADGPVAGLMVEGYVGKRDLAVIPAAPTTSNPAIRASTADGFLSLFNLSAQPVTATVGIAQSRHAIKLYRGTQRVTASGTDYDTTLPAASSTVEPHRFTLKSMNGVVPAGVSATVVNGQRVILTGSTAALVLAQTGGIELPLLGRQEVTFPSGRPYPLADLAVGQVTFPVSPLPAGMSDPAAAVDDDPLSSWTPGPNGRIVVDLGASHAIGAVTLVWTLGVIPGATLSTSVDGRTYLPAGTIPRAFRANITVNATARYVAVATNWRAGQAALRSLIVEPA